DQGPHTIAAVVWTSSIVLCLGASRQQGKVPMFRYSVVILLGLCATAPLPAATWAEALFEGLSRDFGTVPRGPQLTHPFRLTNTTGSPVAIGTIRVSCDCVSARALRTE